MLKKALQNSPLTKKQIKTLYRIIIVLVLFIILLILEKAGLLEGLPRLVSFILYLVPYLIIGYDILMKAGRNISKGLVFDENFLMVIATFGAFGIGEYSEALAVMLFYQIGELFQGYAVGRSRQSITKMMEIAPEYANVLRDGEITKEDPDDVEIGETIVVLAGEKIPLDGTVLEGSSHLDTAALTGESVPRTAAVGDSVVSGCVNLESPLTIRVEKVYEDSTVAKILDLVENAGDKKTKAENFITRFAKVYTPIVTIGAVILALGAPLLLGGGFAMWIRRACVFLIVSCPCALVISVPLGFFGGIGAASKIGVLIKGSSYLEEMSKVTHMVFDKTGTLTKGSFKVTEVSCTKDAGLNEKELLETAARAEALSNHPIALSIREAAGITPVTEGISDYTEIAGKGLTLTMDGVKYFAGNAQLMKDCGVEMEELQADGTVVFLASEKAGEAGRIRLLGHVVISDEIKPEAEAALKELKNKGIKKLTLLSGDREAAAKAVAAKLSMDEVYSDLLPAEKVSALEKILADMPEKEYLAYVGDGINDAPVLMRADVGIAMGGLGSDAAIEASDIVLMDDTLSKLPSLIGLSRRTMRIVQENIVFSIGVKIAVLILGALGLTTMWAAVFADVGVCVIAICNSMRAMYAGK